MSQIDDVKEFWQRRAKEFVMTDSNEMGNTLYDQNLRRLEIDNICKYLSDGLRVLDIGCGNGFSTLHFASKRNLDISGADYSEQMVHNAKALLEKKQGQIRGTVSFLVNNVLEFEGSLEGSFDVVVSERCLINLATWENQCRALANIHRYLKPGGRYLMLEGFVDNLAELNEVRTRYNLPPIKVVWHNLFFQRNAFEKHISTLFDIEAIDNYGSTYMLISRTLFHVLQRQEGQFDQMLDYLATLLPNFGDFNYQRLYVLQKK
jgi:ubiquinone/menaquinone biosynthesis C-methylase UbiE